MLGLSSGLPDSPHWNRYIRCVEARIPRIYIQSIKCVVQGAQTQRVGFGIAYPTARPGTQVGRTA